MTTSTMNPINHRHVRYYGTFCWCGHDLSDKARKKRAAERVAKWRKDHAGRVTGSN